MGVGPTELIIVGLILIVLFGPTLIAFFLGYTIGKKRGAELPGTPAMPSVQPPAPEPTEQPTASESSPQETQPDE